ncbi:DUF6463 family protein [Leptolyngbya sp. NIES-2104]|uniref:DUF6463 family protein n=1 Tax=Leptolyngbya sp. NIES-2104 TaxID=1552121 RepID=UPI0006EC852D|nr:DUF6463 family protein [Leptolyngbya sp. NIES-2104]GAP96678.1 hypothetical protein NIES2104_32210 [Leptolyngbya sp. NIES-2104]
MLRLSGYWLIAIGVLHPLIHGWLFAQPLMEIVQDGWFNTIAPIPLDPFYDREAAFWCMMVTPFLLIIGWLCCWAQTKGINLPSFPGWILLLTAAVGITLEPISGFWLFIPPALLILSNQQRDKEWLKDSP